MLKLHLMLTLVLLVSGFFLLVKGADLLIDGATVLAKRLHVSDLAIGLTVVAFGTSLPELFVNILASAQGNTDLAIGNVLGSNIFNILVNLGVAAIIFPLVITKGTIWKEIPFSLLAVLVLGLIANDALIDQSHQSLLSRIDGLILLGFFMVFMYYTASIAKRTDVHITPSHPHSRTGRSLLLVFLGLAGLVLGGRFVVDSASTIAKHFGMSQSLIGLTIVAIGTSLPELVTSAVAALKKRTDIAVGNVIGSNIFNIFLILGISALIKPIPFMTQLNIDIVVLAVISVLLFGLIFLGKEHRLVRRHGILFVILYICYTLFLIQRG